MVYRLTNEKNPDLIVCMTNQAWFELLDLAEQHGWQPRGAVIPDFLWSSASYHESVTMEIVSESYAPLEERLVMIEDALNLADALERVFLAYEPVRLPSWTGLRFGAPDRFQYGQPGMGVILAVAQLCQSGAFWIEPV